MITSSSNQRIKDARRLLTRKGRHAAGLMLVEGVRLLADAWRSGVSPEIVLYAPEKLTAPQGVQLLSELEARARESLGLLDSPALPAGAEDAPPPVKGLFLLTDYPAVTVRPGTSSTINLRLRNYAMPPERFAISIAGVPSGWTAWLSGWGVLRNVWSLNGRVWPVRRTGCNAKLRCGWTASAPGSRLTHGPGRWPFSGISSRRSVPWSRLRNACSCWIPGWCCNAGMPGLRTRRVTP
jgi:hypothetical protein